MLRRSKLINLICAMMIGVLFMLAVIIVLLVSGVLSVGKTELTFVTPSVEAMYDGTPLTNHTWKMTEGSLKKGHELDVVFKGAQTAVGESENVIEVVITDELGADVTGDYKINYEFGTLKVNPRSLIITSASATKDYDGEPLTAPQYTLSADCDGLVLGHKESVLVTGFLIDVGKINNTVFSVNVYDEEGIDVTRNYKLVIREGLLIINDPNGINGGGSENGGETGNENGNGSGNNSGNNSGNSSGNSSIPDFGGSSSLLPGGGNENVVLFTVFTETDDVIYLKMESFGDYNGRGWENAKAYNELIYGNYSVSYLTSFALGNSGNSFSQIKIKSNCGIYALPYYMSDNGEYTVQSNDVLYEGNTDDVYSVYYYDYANGAKLPSELIYYETKYASFVKQNYLTVDKETREYMEGVIAKNGFSASDPDVIKKVANYIKNAAVYDLEYDPLLDNEKNIAVAFLETYKEGVCRHYASAATLLFRTLGIPARYTVGALAETNGGVWTDVTAKKAHAWVEVYVDGMGWVQVEVTGSSTGSSQSPSGSSSTLGIATLTPVTVRKQYDGTPIYAVNKLSGFKEYENKGYTYEAVVSGYRSEPGKSKSTIESLIIRDPSGKDVTDNFSLKLQEGTVHVYLDVIHCSSNDYSKIYDGKAVPLTVVSDNQLDGTYSFEYTSTANISVGKKPNSFKVNVYDANGLDVTDNYWVIKEYGIADISALEVTFKAGDAKKVYDGTALTCETYTVEFGQLAEGHRVFVCEVVGSQTQIGRSENIITNIVILDENGNNVTANYSIKLLSGQLMVTVK